MKSVLVHDWLMTVAGAEKVLSAMHELFPSAIYTLIKNSKNLENSYFGEIEIHTSFLQKMPFSQKHYRKYLPLFPLAIETFDLSGFDLIISSSHAVAKGVLTHAEQKHICYCHTPMRYAWDLSFEYLNSLNGLKKTFAKFFLHYLRGWDVASVGRVDAFIANSRFIAKRIKKLYGREAQVIYPPIDVEKIPFGGKKEKYYLTASRFVPYKKIDLIVESFAAMPNRKLLVIGEGPEEKRIKSKAAKNIEFLGRVGDETLWEHLRKARAFVFAAIEDFGILPVEAQAAGTPVIAYGKGGACETVIPDKTGLLFKERTCRDIISAVEKFESMEDQFDPSVIREHSQQFSASRFKKEFQEFVRTI